MQEHGPDFTYNEVGGGDSDGNGDIETFLPYDSVMVRLSVAIDDVVDSAGGQCESSHDHDGQ